MRKPNSKEASIQTVPSFDETIITNALTQGAKRLNVDHMLPPAEESIEATSNKPCGTPFCKHNGTCFQNAKRGFLRSFWWGYGAKAALSIIAGLLFRRMYRRPLKLLEDAFGSDSARFAMFLGAFSGGFKGLQCLLRKYRQTEDRWNAFIAAFISGFALGFDSADRRTTIALWLFARALDLSWRSGVEKKYLPDLPHGDVLAFSLSAAQVMWAWHLEPDTLPSSYRHWISARGGLDERIITGVREIVHGNTPDMHSWCKDNNIPLFEQEHPSILPCWVFHPLYPSSCTIHAMKRWLLGFWSGVPVYSMVHILPLLLFRYKTLLKSPLPTMQKTAIAIFYSTSFITSFQAIFWFVFCQVRNIRGIDSRLSTAAAGLASGLSLLWEKKSRRGELALFTIPRSIHSTWNILVKYGYARHIPRANLFVFALAMGVVMTAYQHDTRLINPTYNSGLAKIFGTN